MASKPLSEKTDHTLPKIVAHYHKTRFTRWYLTVIGLSISIGITIIALHLSAAQHYYRAQKENNRLTKNYQIAAKRWSAYQKLSKQLKIITADLTYVTPSLSITQILTKITQTVPPNTLLISLQYHAPANLILTGYAGSPSELASFLSDLSEKSSHPITLTQSHKESPGLFFCMKTNV